MMEALSWWPDEPPATFLTSVGHEQELLDMINGVAIEEWDEVRRSCPILSLVYIQLTLL